MKLELFKIGPFTIYSYGLMIAIGVIAAFILGMHRARKRGLDATPLIQRKLRQVGTPDALAAVGILDTILRDEVSHVAIGNHWYRWLCARDGQDPVALYPQLVARHGAPRLKGPFNLPARRRAGFSADELAALQAAPEAPAR